MHKSQTEEECYDQCTADNLFNSMAEIDLEKIKKSLIIAEEYQKTISELKQKNDRWNVVYKLNYDLLHSLATSFLALFDNISSQDERCVFSFLCVRHPELEFDWDFIEKIISKKKSIGKGLSISRDEYKEIDFQMSLYANSLKDKISKKLAK